MRRSRYATGVPAVILVTLVLACAGEEEETTPPGTAPSQWSAIDQALPDGPFAPPQEERTLLIFNLSKGYLHESIPWAEYAVTRMGEKTGAFTTVVTSDTLIFAPERIAEFDAVLFNNNTGEPFTDPALRASFLAFVRGGGGVVGLHAATDGFFEWPEFGEVMGAFFVSHPWNEEVTLRIEEPDHPITAAFDVDSYVVADEIYQFGEPYSRERQRVLISLDTTALDMEREGVQREDGDFAVCWIREEGQGRVFYSSLGHRFEIFTDPTILRHWLAGIQYALGDLEADATPRSEGG